VLNRNQRQAGILAKRRMIVDREGNQRIVFGLHQQRWNSDFA
jgi:hypothetical protein